MFYITIYVSELTNIYIISGFSCDLFDHSWFRFAIGPFGREGESYTLPEMPMCDRVESERLKSFLRLERSSSTNQKYNKTLFVANMFETEFPCDSTLSHYCINCLSVDVSTRDRCAMIGSWRFVYIYQRTTDSRAWHSEKEIAGDRH